MKNQDLKIIPLNALKDNYIWCLQSGNQIIIVDPGESDVVLSFLEKEQLNLAGILVTHHHWDHTNGINAIIAKHPVPVYGSMHSSNASVTEKVTEGNQLYFKDFGLTLRVLEIPGHTLDHIAFYNDRMAFVGDTLFSSGCGRVFEGTMEMMYASLTKLKNLNDSTQIYCGHEYTLANLKFAKAVEPNNIELDKKRFEAEAKINKQLPSLPSTVLSEKKTNPFFRCGIKEIIESARTYAANHGLFFDEANPISIFEILRTWKNNF